MSGGWQSATPPVATLPVRCGTLPVATLPVGCSTLHARVQPARGQPARPVRPCPGPTCTWQPGWWEEWDDTVLQRQDSKFQPWRSGAEFAISRFRSSQYCIFTSEQGRTFCFFETWMPEPGLKLRSPTFQAGRQPPCIPDRERSSQLTQLMDTRRWTNVGMMLSQLCKLLNKLGCHSGEYFI